MGCEPHHGPPSLDPTFGRLSIYVVDPNGQPLTGVCVIVGTLSCSAAHTYAIDARNSLTVSSAFVIDPATRAPQVSAVADNIVHLRAQYGLDDGGSPPGTGDGSVTFGGTFVAGDGLVDRFVSAAVFNAIVPAPWQSLIAVRLAIVARSALAEKPLGSDGAKCDATTDGTETTPGPDRRPRWSGGVIDVTSPGWLCLQLSWKESGYGSYASWFQRPPPSACY